MTLYTHLSAALVGAAVAATGAWVAQGWRYDARIAKSELVHSEAAASAAKSALRMTEIYRENANAAVRKSEARASQDRRDAGRLRDELAGMRGDLADVPERIRSATRDAVDQYAATANQLFDQCTRRYSKVATAAQGHAADVETLSEAWPRANRPVQPRSD